MTQAEPNLPYGYYRDWLGAGVEINSIYFTLAKPVLASS